jgi:predicted O-methyltransferase YrrM
MIEIGTSAAYSTLWLWLACRERAERLVSFEVLAAKHALARQSLAEAGILDEVDLQLGDARAHLSSLDEIGFCFLDAEKDVYRDCYDQVVPRLVPGGLLVADNAISHREDLQGMLDAALADERVDAMIVPVGMGELLCRKRK